MIERFGHATPDDWLERNLYTRWRNLGVVLLFGIDVVLFGVAGVAVWAAQMVWIPFWAAGIINGVGHYWGYRNYESPDASVNIVPWGIVIGGEELHNNHHAFPSSARLSSKWWEFDLGWFYIRFLSLMGLARVKKLAPRLTRIEGKEAVDMDTLRAVLRGRMHVLARYARDVLVPVSRSELCDSEASCRRVYRQARKLLVRERARLDELSLRRLQSILEKSQTLQTVYQYRQRLDALWGRKTAGPDSLLASLQEWCRQAEDTGIQCLQEFARNLRSYSLKPAG
jgi:stearoyl-CoA desaturase (delta-9 desaturase)